MKKVLKLTIALFLIGAVLSGVGYGLGGRVPDRVVNHLNNGLQMGVSHVRDECHEHYMDFQRDPDHDGWDVDWD